MSLSLLANLLERSFTFLNLLFLGQNELKNESKATNLEY